jgi:hypothetical protein
VTLLRHWIWMKTSRLSKDCGGVRSRISMALGFPVQDEGDRIVGSRFGELIHQQPAVAGDGVRGMSATRTPRFDLNLKKNPWRFRFER